MSTDGGTSLEYNYDIRHVQVMGRLFTRRSGT